MEPISKIANIALDEITNGQFPSLPKLAITGLLNDFQYAWLRRFKIPYKFEMLDLARNMCNGENKAVFRATKCKSTKEIRKKFSLYIKKWHKDDDRVILSLSCDGKQINAEWLELKEYLKI
ncbi:MAG: hypothetical protein ACTSW1_15555 [Candidatus Hodarchaeales archaeon]